MLQPHHRHSQAIGWLCSLGLFVAGYVFYISALIEPFYAKAFSLSHWQIGMAQSAVPLGAMLGAVLAGWLADLFGRQRLLSWNFLLLAVFGLLQALTYNYHSLIAARALNGLLAGTLYPLCAAYLTEMTPSAEIAKKTAILMFVNCLAAPVGCLFAILLYSIFSDHLLWRTLAAFHAVPALAGYWWSVQLPESYAWVNQKGSIKKRSTLYSLRLIFNKSYWRITVCLMGTWFLMDVAYYGINFFVPYLLQIMQQHPLSSHFNSQTLLSQETLWGTGVISFFFMLGALGAIFLINKFNLYKLQQLGFLFASSSLFMLAGYFYIGLPSAFAIISLFVLFNFALNLGPDVTTYLLSATSYPVEIRGSGHGFVAGFAKLGSVIGVLFLPNMQAIWGYEMIIIGLSSLLFCAFVLTRILAKVAPSEREIVKEDLGYEAT